MQRTDLDRAFVTSAGTAGRTGRRRSATSCRREHRARPEHGEKSASLHRTSLEFLSEEQW